MSEPRLSVSIRMTRELLDRLKEAADKNSHSMNAEIVSRLEKSIEPKNQDSELLRQTLMSYTLAVASVTEKMLDKFSSEERPAFERLAKLSLVIFSETTKGNFFLPTTIEALHEKVLEFDALPFRGKTTPE